MFSFPSIGLLSSALFLLVVDNSLVAGTIVAVDRGIGRRELRAARRASGRNARFVDMASCEDKCNGATTSYLESECFGGAPTSQPHITPSPHFGHCKSPEWNVFPARLSCTMLTLQTEL